VCVCVRANATFSTADVVAPGFTASVVAATADTVASDATTAGDVVLLPAFVAAAAVATAISIVCGCGSVRAKAPWDQLTTKARKF